MVIFSSPRTFFRMSRSRAAPRASSCVCIWTTCDNGSGDSLDDSTLNGVPDAAIVYVQYARFSLFLNYLSAVIVTYRPDKGSEGSESIFSRSLCCVSISVPCLLSSLDSTIAL